MVVGPLQRFLFETLTEGVTKQGNLTSRCFIYLGRQLSQFTCSPLLSLGFGHESMERGVGRGLSAVLDSVLGDSHHVV